MRADELAPEPKIAGPELLNVGKTTGLAAAVVAILIGLGAFGMGAVTPVTQGDKVSGGDTARLVEGFRNASGSLLPVDISTDNERLQLLRALDLPKLQVQRLLAMVERGERALGWLTLWDNYDEDGDIASVTAGGMTQRVVLTRTPVRILIPYIPGQPVFVTGERDGMGGGVTLAVELSTGPLPLPPLAVGQTVVLPIL
jgi:hypothetical protein